MDQFDFEVSLDTRIALIAEILESKGPVTIDFGVLISDLRDIKTNLGVREYYFTKILPYL